MDATYENLQRTIAQASDTQVFTTVVNAPFAHKLEVVKLCLGIIVLLLVDKQTGLIHRVALSNTELAAGTKRMSAKKFEEIVVPLDYEENCIAQAIRTGEQQCTTDWKYLFAPALTAKEARFNQAGGAIAFSAVHPLPGVGDGGALIFSYYQYPNKIGEAQKDFMEHYAALVAERLSAVPAPLKLARKTLTNTS